MAPPRKSVFDLSALLVIRLRPPGGVHNSTILL
jgi:hypothetical protein